MSSTILKFQHTSLQFSDSAKHQAADIERIFGTGFHILTGTEAGRENSNFHLVQEAAADNGYLLNIYLSNWVAVRKDIVAVKSWESGGLFVADNKERVGPGHDSGFPWVRFRHPEVGSISVAVAHYPTQGGTKNDPNYDINERYAHALGKWAKGFGKDKDLAFVAGDFNMSFAKGPDPLFGEPMTSVWNELARFENTGHGNIDAILSYDKDERVKAKWTKVLDDSEMTLNIDHFVVQAAFEITNPKTATK